MLTFDEATHTYRYGDVVVPNVTRILDPLTDWSRIRPDVLERKRQIGTAVHKACELDDLGTLDDESVDPLIRGYLNAYRKFTREMRPQWYAIEERLFHNMHQYAGTLDRYGTVLDEESLVDIKSGDHLKVHHLQLSAYRGAYKPATNNCKRATLHLNADGTYKYRVDTTDHARNMAVFLSALNLWRWQQ